jgi:hypothetical protein
MRSTKGLQSPELALPWRKLKFHKQKSKFVWAMEFLIYMLVFAIATSLFYAFSCLFTIWTKNLSFSSNKKANMSCLCSRVTKETEGEPYHFDGVTGHQWSSVISIANKTLLML